MGWCRLPAAVLTASLTLLYTHAAPAAQPAAQQVIVETDTALLVEPRADAAVVTQLRKGVSGEQLGKQGMFYNVKMPGGTGWVYAFNVRVPPAGGAGTSGGAARGPNVSGRVNVTSTIGIRGLSEEDLRKAVTDPAQLKLLDSYVASAQEAEAAAGQSGLTAVKVEYFK